MTDLLTNLLINSWSSHPHALAIGLDLAIKSTLLILLAIAAAAILGRGRILLRTALWNACLLGLLVLPATTIALPRLRIAVLPAPNTTAAAAFIPTPAPGPGIESTLAGANAMYLATPPGAASAQSAAAPTTIKPVDTAKAAGPGARPTRTQADTPSWNIDWLATCILVYAAGILVMAVRLVYALVAVKTLRRSGQPVTESAWVDTFTIWTKRLEITWPVRLLHSPQVNVPVAFGWWRPVVMIPSDMMATAGQSLRNSVLLHELAHVRRCDYLWQLLMRATQIIYWPNPLIWLMARSLSAACEEASDAFCVHHAGDPNEYCLTLLEVAQSLLHKPAAALGIAMARSPRIAQRLERINRGLRVPDCLASRPARSVITFGAIIITAVVGACQLAAKDNTASTPEVTVAADKAPTTQPTRMRYFVLLVVGKDKLTFQGQPTTWNDLPRLLEQVPNRPTTVLAVAAASDQMTLHEVNDTRSRGGALARQFGFEYLSYVGVHPLGSKGDPPQPVNDQRTTEPPVNRGVSGTPTMSAPAATQPPVAGLPQGLMSADQRALVPRNIVVSRGPKVTFGSETAMEFVGAHTLTQQNTWWGFDGTILKEALCEPCEPRYRDVQKSGDKIIYPPGVREYRFIFQITDPKGAPEVFPNLIPWTCNVKDAKNSFMSAMIIRQGRPTFGFRSIQATLPADQKTASITIGLASGDWKTRLTSTGTFGGGTSKEGWDILFSAAAEIQGAATISVSDNGSDDATRIIAIDTDGQIHEAPCANTVAGETSRMTQGVFPRLPLSQVKEFRFQTCDYNWVLFPNIPLQPGPHRTKTIPSNLPAVKVDATSRPSANTVVERTINADAIGHDCLIDFDSGKLLSPPHPDGRKVTDVFKEKGIDAACTTEQFGPGLYGFDMVVSPVDSEAWDAWDKEPFRTLVHHVQNGKPGTPAVMSAAGQLPVTYMFKTREGGVGIVQILELRNEAVARFIRIRYRMLTAPIGSAAGATTAPPSSALSQPPHPNPR